MEETAHLKWTNINKNLDNTFKRLKGNSDFSDVTLVCEDGQKTVVHKAMLAASSPLFHGLLNSERNDHQMIILAGVKSEYVSSVVDFIYCGQAMVQKANVDSFIAIANDLKLEAIFGKTKSNFDDEEIYTISVPVEENTKVMQSSPGPMTKILKCVPETAQETNDSTKIVDTSNFSELEKESENKKENKRRKENNNTKRKSEGETRENQKERENKEERWGQPGDKIEIGNDNHNENEREREIEKGSKIENASKKENKKEMGIEEEKEKEEEKQREKQTGKAKANNSKKETDSKNDNDNRKKQNTENMREKEQRTNEEADTKIKEIGEPNQEKARMCKMCEEIFTSSQMYQEHKGKKHNLECPLQKTCKLRFVVDYYKNLHLYKAHKIGSKPWESSSTKQEKSVAKLVDAPLFGPQKNLPARNVNGPNWAKKVREPSFIAVEKRAFLCEQCDKKFPERHQLKKHVAELHPSRCKATECNMTFGTHFTTRCVPRN